MTTVKTHFKEEDTVDPELKKFLLDIAELPGFLLLIVGFILSGQSLWVFGCLLGGVTFYVTGSYLKLQARLASLEKRLEGLESSPAVKDVPAKA